MSQTKVRIPEMLPIKKWLTKGEAMAYLDLSDNLFNKVVEGLTVSAPTSNKKLYYKVSELDEVMEKAIIIRKIST